MNKHIILCLCLLVGSAFAQTHTEDTLEDAQTVSGAKTFSGLATFAGAVNIGASASGKIVYLTVPVGSDIGAQANLACANNPSGAWIIFPPGTYDVKTAITGCSNSVFMGAGIDNTILEGNVLSTTLGANPVFNLVNLNNYTVTGFTIRNGTASTVFYTAGMNGLNHTGGSHAWIYGNKFTEIQGVAATQERSSTDIHIFNNIYFRCTYACDSALNDNVGIYIQNNYVDTITCLSCTNTYLMAQGADSTNGTNYTQDYWVEDNTLKNNPLWSCLDSHGGSNIWFLRNHCLNTGMGATIQAAINGGSIANPTNSTIRIEDNIFEQGTGDIPSHGNLGIAVQGNNGAGTPAQKVSIIGNKMIGFGASQGGAGNQIIGVIQLYNVKGATVSDNDCLNYNQACILLYYWNQDVTLYHNRAINMAGAAVSGTSAGFETFAVGNYGILWDSNSLEATGSGGLPNSMFYSSGVIGGDSMQWRNNLNKTSAANYGGSFSTWPVEINSVPGSSSAFIMKYGDSVLNLEGQVGWTVNTTGTGSKKTGYGSLDSTDTVLLANCTNGSNVVTNLTGQTYQARTTDYRWIPDGMNVSLAGCGVAAAALTANVVQNTTQIVGGGVTSATRTANVVTFNTASNTNMIVGQTFYAIAVQGGLNTTAFDGQFVVSTVSGTQVTAAQTAGNDTATPSTGNLYIPVLILDTNASTTQTQIALTYQPLTFSPFAVDGTGRVFVNQNGIAILGGGTTSSFSGLRFNGTTVQAVLADNSAFTTIQERGLTVTENSALSGLGGSDLLWGDSTAHRLKTNPNNTGATTLAAFTDNLGVFASGGTITPAAYASSTNCAVNSVSPAACSAAAAGAFVVPTTTTTYTVNTTAVTAASRIFLMPMSFAGNLPSAPTCVTPAITSSWSISAITAATSFTFALPSTAGQTCWQYWIVD